MKLKRTRSSLTLTLSFLMLMAAPEFAHAQDGESQPNPEISRLQRDERLKRQVRQYRRLLQLQRLRREQEKKAASQREKDDKNFGIFGAIGGTVYIYETDKSFEPDFETHTASLGLRGHASSFDSELALSVGSGGESVAVTKAYLRWSGFQDLFTLKAGRDAVPTISTYATSLNHGMFYAGESDALTSGLKFTFPGDGALSLTAGVANGLPSDATTTFGKRATNENRAFGVTGSASIAAIELKGAWATQWRQIQQLDDAETADFNEESSRDIGIIEASLGLSFEHLKVGGFYAQETRSEESYLYSPERAMLPAEYAEKLANAEMKSTFGGGMTVLSQKGVATQDSDQLSFGIGFSQLVAEPGDTESAIAASAGYTYGPAGVSVSFGHFVSSNPEAYTDQVTETSDSEVQRLTVGFSYNFL